MKNGFSGSKQYLMTIETTHTFLRIYGNNTVYYKMKTIDSRNVHDPILCIGEEDIYIYIKNL